MRYRVLGSVAVEVDGIGHLIRRRRESLILCLLLAAHGAPVSADRLVAQAWGDGRRHGPAPHYRWRFATPVPGGAAAGDG